MNGLDMRVTVRRFEILEYNQSKDVYETTTIINENEIIQYDFTEEDYPDTDSLEMEVEFNQRFMKYVPQSSSEYFNMKPMVIAQFVGEHLMWFSYIIGRESVEVRDKKSIVFKGVGFTWFHKSKLLNSNLDFSHTGEVNDLPEDFGMYKLNGTINQHMLYMFNNAYLNPMEVTYGKLSKTPDPRRKFKGLGRVRSLSKLTQKSTIRMEQNYLTDFVDRVYEVFNHDLQFRQRIVKGKIDITLSDPTVLGSEVVRKQTDVVEEVQEQSTDTNFVYGYGWGNAYVTVTNNQPAYFTTIEHREDLAYIGRNNLDYIRNTSNTILRRKQMNLVRHIIKINSDQFFFKIVTGCIINYKGVPYRVTTIKETNSREEGLAFDVEIKEVENE